MADKSRGNGDGDGDGDRDRDGDVKIGDRLTVDVEAPVAGGQCIARLDGRVVFVRDAIPGERVEVRVTGTGKRGGFLRADTQRVIRASPHRVVPPCPLARECGGCDWQHVEVDFQCQLKKRAPR
ncbi:MAG: TRAM domain-containing protein [Candidatus Nanopelagicales bacterium]|nr:TRAM domain-containing protein [Candidatus Nanopelagicales bacterium]